MRRVVVTGLGCITPLASGMKETWERLIKGESGIRTVRGFDASDLPSKVAGQVPLYNGADDGEQPRNGVFNPDDWMAPREQRRVDTFIIFGFAAAGQALQDAGWFPTDEEEQERTGVMIGSGIGGLPWINECAIKMHEEGTRRVTPYFIPAALINLVSGHVSIKHGFKGPNHSAVTACSTGAHAIGDASRIIMLDDADVMLAGGTEASVSRLGIAGFAAARALSTDFNDEPHRASRPWDRDRDGFVMGEGAGCVVLEELEHAKKRGRQDLCRGDRLRHVRRCLSHHRAAAGRQRRLPVHAQRAQAG